MLNIPTQTHRIQGLSGPRIQEIMNGLAEQTKSINLGLSYPSWDPPQFYLKFLQQAQYYSTHQYTDVFGSKNYRKAIANFHQKSYKGYDLKDKIIAVNGASEAIYCCITGLVNEGEEVIVFDPACELYRPQIQMAGGKTVAIQLKPKRHHSKKELMERFEKQLIESSQDDEWEFDWNNLQVKISQKTKLLIITNPHNAVGKIFSHNELHKIAQIMRKHPHVAILEDNTYEGITYDDMLGKPLLKMADFQGMFQRTLSVYTAGKILQATGVKCGWIIGPPYLLKCAGAVYQVTCFDQYNVIENAIAKSLDHISNTEPQYLINYAREMKYKRNLLLKALAKSDYDFDLWVPKAGFFIIADISRVYVKQQYFRDKKGNKLTKNHAFANQLAHENGVVCIPCISMFGTHQIQDKYRFVKFSFCRSDEDIFQAEKRLTHKQ